MQYGTAPNQTLNYQQIMQLINSMSQGQQQQPAGGVPGGQFAGLAQSMGKWGNSGDPGSGAGVLGLISGNAPIYGKGAGLTTGANPTFTDANGNNVTSYNLPWTGNGGATAANSAQADLQAQGSDPMGGLLDSTGAADGGSSGGGGMFDWLGGLLGGGGGSGAIGGMGGGG